MTELLDSILTIKSLSNHFISLDKLVNLSGQLIVLVGHHSDVVVHGVNLDLKVCVVLKEGRVGVSGTLKLLAHVHQLVLLLSNLHLKLFDGTTELHVLAALSIDSPLKVSILILVTLLQALQVVQL